MIQRFNVSVFLVFGWLTVLSSSRAPADQAQDIFDQAEVAGGVILHLGCADGSLSGDLHADGRFLVFGLADKEADLDLIRKKIYVRGLYGPVSVDSLEGSQIPLNDDLVNLVVAEDLLGIEMDEIIRVLCPHGVALVKDGSGWKKTTKPRPKNIDDWTHFFHGPDGNAVAQDERVGPPTRLQWLGSPRWSRHHDRMASMSALVSGGGKLFYIMDEGSRVSIQLPSKWMLTARDAFNSKVLWKQPIQNWHDQLWPLKSGPTQLAKRLVTDGKKVFAPLSLGAPVSCLDADSGKILATYEATKNAEEMVLVGNRLFVLSNPADWALKEFNVLHNTGDQKRVSQEFSWNEEHRQLRAVDINTGEVLWMKESKVSPLSLVADAKRVVFHDGAGLISLNPSTGNEAWKNTEASRRSLFEFNYGPRIVLHKEVVLYAGGDGKKMGINPVTGDTIWKAGDPKSGYRSPQDLLVASGLVWTAPLTSGRDSGVFTGLDLLTGEVKKEFPPNVETYWFHHRCYISKGTEKYIMPSRTGIEFVDHEKEHWDINHWVRGGCLYGVMPANGLTYAPPHNCACYPEAKLFGFNALAAGGSEPEKIPAAARLEKGPAYGFDSAQHKGRHPGDWPTYRHDNERSGYTEESFGANLEKAWKNDLGGKLSAPTAANGKIYLAQVDAHAVYALDEKTGETVWTFMAGGRVDSPPTIDSGRAIFGCTDGSVYCLTADAGELIWRFRAAPSPRRTMIFEQLESLWPVPGSVLVEEGVVSFVAGRSAFLDGGMRFFRLDAATGEVIAEQVIDDRDPETGSDLQDRLQTLQMPVALNDILSSDGKYTYLRSQKIERDGTRVDIGPVSGNAALQGGTQAGEGAHVFAPMGFLDDTWFHRSYWVYGKNFAGGHNGYFQAGKHAPAGRILVFDNENVYGYGREPQYLKWTTTLEHQLFSASRKIDDHTASIQSGKNPRSSGNSMPVVFQSSNRINPAKRAITVETWVMADQKTGVVLAHGGPMNGFALILTEGKPSFQVRADANLAAASSPKELSGGWHHLAGVLDSEANLKLYVDGKQAATGKSTTGLLAKIPAQTLDLGGDAGASVGEYEPNRKCALLLDEFAVYHRALSAEEIAARCAEPGAKPVDPVLACSFDSGNANDESGGKNHGVMSGVDFGKGVKGSALWVQRNKTRAGKGKGKAKGRTNLPKNNTWVEHNWTKRVPLYARAMALANDTLIIAGPPDTIDEEYTFAGLAQKDSSVHELLAAQDKALQGDDGAVMQLVSINDGEPAQRLNLDCLPVWDGMAVVRGKLIVCGEDGSIRCFAPAKNQPTKNQ